MHVVQRLDSLASMEAGGAAGHKQRALHRIPSFEAYVELWEDTPAGKSRHDKSTAARTAEEPPQQQQQQQAEALGGARVRLGAAARTGGTADNSSPDHHQQQQQQEQQQAGGTGSVPCPGSATGEQAVYDLQPPFSVIVMPDGQHLALAVPEIDPAQDTDASAGSSEGSPGQTSAESGTQQQQQHQQQQQRRPMQGVLQRTGHALLRAVVYLFVQPVPSASDFEQSYAAGRQRGSNGATIL
jgi:hypothetical protein